MTENQSDNPPQNLVCREAVPAINVLHAVIKMVELTHKSRCTGNGFKPPKGALVKSQGIERYGKGYAKSWSGMNNGDEWK
jgi:hypothetical protein